MGYRLCLLRKGEIAFMTTYETQNAGWNLFARVLQEILAAHDLGLGHLDDRIHIHPEKVRRLQRSLKVSKSFPMLNSDELAQIIAVFQLSRTEKMRLRAAVLATSVEATLMDRINQDDALRAAEQILPIIEQALQEHEYDLIGIGAIKGGEPVIEESEIDRKLGSALSTIDRATLSLHLSSNAASHMERIECAQQAHDHFTSALMQLNNATPDLKQSDAWHVWHDEARNGLAAAQKRLATLGA
jgi:hypothetical protein